MMDAVFMLKGYLNGNPVVSSLLNLSLNLGPCRKCKTILCVPTWLFFYIQNVFELCYISALLSTFYPFIVCFLSISALLLGLIYNKCNLRYILSWTTVWAGGWKSSKLS